MKQVNKESTRNNATLDLVFRKEMKEIDFMPFVFQLMYSEHSTVGFRYCKDGVISKEYRELQINKQDKEFLKKTTLDGMTEQGNYGMGEQEKATPKTERSTKGKKNVPIPSSEDNEDIIVMDCPLDVARLSNIRKLLIGEWIDSNIINCYFYMISRDFSHVFTMDSWFNEKLKSRMYG